MKLEYKTYFFIADMGPLGFFFISYYFVVDQ